MPEPSSAAPREVHAQISPARWLAAAPLVFIGPPALPAGRATPAAPGQPREPLAAHPAVQRLQSEFGPPEHQENTLKWVFRRTPAGRQDATLVAAPMRFEGWAEFTLTYAAGRGHASYRTAINRIGPSLESLLALVREAAEPGDPPR